MVPATPGTIGTQAKHGSGDTDGACPRCDGDFGQARGHTRDKALLARPRREPQRRLGSASAPSGQSLGPPQLIDGYANGWYVTPPRERRAHRVAAVQPAEDRDPRRARLGRDAGSVPRARFRAGRRHRSPTATQPRELDAVERPGTRADAVTGARRSRSTAGGSRPRLLAGLPSPSAAEPSRLLVLPPPWAVPIAVATAWPLLVALPLVGRPACDSQPLRGGVRGRSRRRHGLRPDQAPLPARRRRGPATSRPPASWRSWAWSRSLTDTAVELVGAHGDSRRA